MRIVTTVVSVCCGHTYFEAMPGRRFALKTNVSNIIEVR